MIELNQKVFREFFVYCPLSGKIISKVTRKGGVKGKEVGTNHNGYTRIKFKGKSYMAHRLAFLDIHGEGPKQEVDHINGIRDDNRWINLRDVSKYVNQRNSSLRSDNKSGYPGVYWSDQHNKWRVQIRNKFLGQFDKLETAIGIRKQAENVEGFHPNHGRETNFIYEDES